MSATCRSQFCAALRASEGYAPDGVTPIADPCLYMLGAQSIALSGDSFFVIRTDSGVPIGYPFPFDNPGDSIARAKALCGVWPVLVRPGGQAAWSTAYELYFFLTQALGAWMEASSGGYNNVNLEGSWNQGMFVGGGTGWYQTGGPGPTDVVYPVPSVGVSFIGNFLHADYWLTRDSCERLHEALFPGICVRQSSLAYISSGLIEIGLTRETVTDSRGRVQFERIPSASPPPSPFQAVAPASTNFLLECIRFAPGTLTRDSVASDSAYWPQEPFPE